MGFKTAFQILLSIQCIALYLPMVVCARHRACTQPTTTALSYRGDGQGLQEIYNTLVTCPNVTSLDLEFAMMGCVVSDYPWRFRFRNGDRFSDLRNLRLSGYDLLGRKRIYGSATSWLSTAQDLLGELIPAFARRPTDWVPDPDVNAWLRAMDWTKLEELRLEQEEDIFYTAMKDNLPGIRRLSLSWMNSGSTVPQERINFIRSMPPLESLSIRIGAPYYYDTGVRNRTQFPLADILEVHGPSLHSLSLHQAESHEPNLRRPMFSIEEISAIQAACPDLTHLGLDLDRDASNGWPNTTLETIMSIESLKNLTLGLEIGADMHASEPGGFDWNPEGLAGSGPFREPRMSLQASEALFADLRARKRGEELKKVEFVVGDYTEVPYRGPLYTPAWEEGRARKFVCDTTSLGVSEGGHCSVVGDRDPYRGDVVGIFTPGELARLHSDTNF